MEPATDDEDDIMVRQYRVVKRFTGGLLNGTTHTSEFHHDDASTVAMWATGQHVEPFMSSPFKVESVIEIPLPKHLTIGVSK
jgi:hypothetical protein